MNKIVSFAMLALAVLTISGCSGDESENATKMIKATINGQKITFDTFAISHDTYTVDGVEYELLTVSGSSSFFPSEILFDVTKGITGTENVDSVRLRMTQNGSYYYGYTDDDFVVNITSNSNSGHKIKGTFSGIVHNGNGDNIPVTDGTIDITY